jgi:hypothetical protein
MENPLIRFSKYAIIAAIGSGLIYIFALPKASKKLNIEGNLELSSSNFSSEEILGQLIKSDLSNLFEKKYLDKDLKNVSKVYFSIRTPKIKNSVQSIDPFVKPEPEGLYFLTMDIYEFPDDTNEAYLLQYNWVNSKTNNKDYEMSRVYKVRKSIPQKTRDSKSRLKI